MDRREWLEADGLGGFASGTVSGVRTRRYHALLLTATRPPTGRFVLVNGFDASVTTPEGTFAISSQRYAPETTHPDGERRIESFTPDPWPRWIFRLEDGTRIAQEIIVPHEIPAAVVSWKLLEAKPGVTLSVRPFLSGRDFHSLHHENPSFRMGPEDLGGPLRFRPYDGVPGVLVRCNAQRYRHEPQWYRNFLYEEERARGLDFLEDLASPGAFEFDLSQGEALWTLSAEGYETALGAGPPSAFVPALRERETSRRARFRDGLERAGDAYLVRRGTGRSIIAGYPWFADWGRDTFISLRGLLLATGRLDEAFDVLDAWSGMISRGMVPNAFPDGAEELSYGTVDGALWYVVAAGEWLDGMRAAGRPVSPAISQRFEAAMESILTGYSTGTRYGIRADKDALVASGEKGRQLTWMDAKIGDRVITPRMGKPVEIQALWLNALRMGARWAPRWNVLFKKGVASFRERFWNASAGYLNDVVDPAGEKGMVDATLRPNQIFAVGGLPVPILEGERAERVVEAVESALWTSLGLRTLVPGHPDYHPRYGGGPMERDEAYHQGTAWPWLLGPFVEAWVRVRGGGAEVKREARRRFLEPLLAHRGEAGFGHLPEVADGDLPQRPGGCPFQAWSVGEALRLDRVVLADEGEAAT